MSPQTPVKEDFGVWLPLFEEYRITTLRHDLLVRGRLREGLDPSSPEVLAAIAAWSGAPHFQAEGDDVEVALVVPGQDPPARLWLHALLLSLTLLTTLGAGSMLAGFDPFDTRVSEIAGVAVPYPTALRWPVLALGGAFAFPFLGILLAHELGHWATARRHGIRASLPYFIPLPPYVSLIGTIGAFIRLRGPTIRRSHLFDVGAAGPVAGLVLSVPLLAIGMALSETVAGPAGGLSPYLVRFAGTPVWLGDGLLPHALAALFAPGGGRTPLLLHPVAFAGWLGLFVTALNLLPMGQLDGGHVLYAMLGAGQRRIARLFIMALVPLGLLWHGWWVWAAIVAFLHRGRLRHPRVVQPDPPIGAGRQTIGWLLVVVFFMTFVPVPLRL